MEMAAIYHKTPKGQLEIKERAGKLDLRHRSLLILTNGQRTGGKLLEMTQALHMSAKDLDDLELEKYIQPEVRTAASAKVTTPATATPAAAPTAAKTAYDRYAEGQAYMNDIAKTAMGLKAFFFVLKIEKCSNAADLHALMGDFEKAITKARDATYGVAARKTAEAILAA